MSPFDADYFVGELGEFWVLLGHLPAWESGAVEQAHRGLCHIFMSLLSPEDAEACETAFRTAMYEYGHRKAHLGERTKA